MNIKNMKMVEIEGHVLHLSNLEKVLWPDQKISKAMVIKYYADLAPYLLPHIKNRPLVMKRQPDGIQGDFFFQKECPSYAPDWIETYPVKHTRKIINYVVCNNLATLVWLANQGCIEMHSWLSRVENIDYPDLAVVDLDPSEGVNFTEVMRVALAVRSALDRYGLVGYPKTSGSRGVHIFIPLNGRHVFADVTKAMKQLEENVVRAYPDQVTMERSIARRKGKVYLDYLQNGRGKTMAFPYSIRTKPGAPVSAPLTWQEVEEMHIDPVALNMFNIPERLGKIGDLWSDMHNHKQSLMSLINLKPGNKLPAAANPNQSERSG